MVRFGAGASAPHAETRSRRPHAEGHRCRNGRLRSDDRGQLLILTGVLLVLGFVVIGTTVVQLRGLEDSTSRLQRDALLDSVDSLVANFNRTIVSSIELGDTNTTDFTQRGALAESRLRETATRAGLYVSVELQNGVDRSVFWRDSRCAAYNVDEWANDNGIVIGWDRATGRESIVGSVYDIHITDGRQTVRMDYYVKIYQCMVQNTPSHIDEVTVDPGTVQNLTGSHEKDVVGLSWVNETLSGNLVNQKWVVPGAINVTSVGWLGQENIKTEVNSATKATEVNRIDFQFALPAGLQDSHSIPDFKISVHSQHTEGLVNNDDILYLEGYDKYDLNQTIIYRYQVPLPAVGVNTTFQPGPSPAGNDHWTREDLEKITWRLRVQAVNDPDIGRTIKVHYVTADVTWEQPEGYQLDATFDLAKIPRVFDQHDLNVRYRFEQDPAADPETFELQVYNGATDAWDTLDTWNSMGGAWQDSGPWRLTKDPGVDDQSNTNQPRFRIVDELTDDDDVAEDRDSIEIDWFELTSSVSGA